MKTRWHLITGEYPPQLGGVADYTRQLAQGLAAAGDDVIVWAPRVDRPTPCDDGVTVRRLPGHFGPAALVELDAALARSPGRIVLQYAPHAFGWKAMNVPLCVWLWARSRGLDVMFHEVAYPFVARQPLKHQLLAGVHRVMASLLLRGAERVFVSVPGWTSLLRPLARRFPQPIWSPVPSNLPTELTASEIGAARGRLQTHATRLVGHFGTYSPWLCAQVESVMLKILAQRSDVGVLLLGRGSSAFADRIKQRQPELTGRLMGVGALEGRDAAAHIACCDVMVQPFPDGVSARRSSFMAALALGRAIVSNEGEWSEPIWRTSAAVELAPLDQLSETVLDLLDSPARLQDLGQRAGNLYRSVFVIEHTIHLLRSVGEMSFRARSAKGKPCQPS